MRSNRKKNILLKCWLFPFAWLYGWVIRIRHFLFDTGLLSSTSYDLPIICVGNLSTGGTGKTPMVLYLLSLLKDRKVATLSRGYKRKSKGFIIATESTSADTLGDEPFLFHERFPHMVVSVSEDRRTGIEALQALDPAPELILLDDGYQHRKVRPGFSILLSDYGELFSRDYFLPVGNLRDSRSAASRAQIIVVTKCPEDLNLQHKEKITAELQKYGPKIVLFSYIKYQKPISLINGNLRLNNESVKILLVHGIANASSLRRYVRRLDPDFKELAYADHYDYKESDIQRIKLTLGELAAGQQIIITTEKDGGKLKAFHHELKDLPIYILPIELGFLFQEQERFDKEVLGFIDNFKK